MSADDCAPGITVPDGPLAEVARAALAGDERLGRLGARRGGVGRGPQDGRRARCPVGRGLGAASTAGVQASIIVLSPTSALPRSTTPSRAAVRKATTASASSSDASPRAPAPLR